MIQPTTSMILPTSSEQLAKALFPGLKAITMQSMSKAILVHAEKLIQEWVSRSLTECSVSASTDPDGNLIFLVKVKSEDLVA